MANREAAPPIESAAGLRCCRSSLRSSPLKRTLGVERAVFCGSLDIGDTQVGRTGGNR